MFTCPICDAEIHKDNADTCPECKWQLCVNCHRSAANESKYACCNTNECRYYGKRICTDCAGRDRVGVTSFLPGALIGLLIDVYAAIQIQQFNRTVLFAFVGVVVLCSLIGRLVFGATKRCPRCTSEVIYQTSDVA